jgi:hypothetical protein
MLVQVYDRVTGRVVLTSGVNSEDMLARGGGRYGLGDVCPPSERMTEAEWAKAANLPEPKAPVPEVNKVMAGEGLPMPADEPAPVESTSERVELIASLRIAGKTFDASAPTDALRDLLAGTEVVGEGAGLSDDDAPVLSVPAADPLDHDGDGKKGGARKPVDPERAAIIAALKAAKIKFFLGAPTEKLKALLPG